MLTSHQFRSSTFENRAIGLDAVQKKITATYHTALQAIETATVAIDVAMSSIMAAYPQYQQIDWKTWGNLVIFNKTVETRSGVHFYKGDVGMVKTQFSVIGMPPSYTALSIRGAGLVSVHPDDFRKI